MKFSKACTVLLLLAAAGTATASTYNGLGPGTSTINAGGGSDYTSLSAAIAAINSSPLTGGDWTFLIASNLTETQKLAIGQNTNGHRITFKPAPAAQPIVTFNTTESTSLGWSSHLIIGTATKNNALANVKTDNIVIDGSNNGTASRDLTIQNTLNANSTNLISIVSDADAFEIRNCNLIANTSTTSAVVRFAAINEGAFVNLTPDSGTVENCSLTGIGPSSSGVAIERGGGSVDTVGATDITVRNNEIVAELRGIFATDYREVTVAGNLIGVDSVATSNACAGISFGTGTTAAAQITLDIFENEIVRVRRPMNATNTINGIILVGAAGAGAPDPVVRVSNNSVGGVTASGIGSPSLGAVGGIRIAVSNADIEVTNNSVHVAVPANYTISSPAVTNVGIGIQSTSASSTVDVRNNIVRYDSSLGFAVYRAATAGTWTLDSNSYFNTGGALFGSDAGTDAANLSAWQTLTSLDASSVVQDPFVANPPAAGVWTSASDLRFTNPAAISFAGVPISGITTDADGVTRDSLLPYKGAFEGNGYVNARVNDALQYD